MSYHPYYWCVWPSYSGPHTDSSLRESHDALLAAAKEAFNELSFQASQADVEVYDALKAAIAKAEGVAP